MSTQVNLDALNDDLTDAFIRYQDRIENPMAFHSDDYNQQRYITDTLFKRRVQNLVSGVTFIVIKHIDQ